MSTIKSDKRDKGWINQELCLFNDKLKDLCGGLENQIVLQLYTCVVFYSSAVKACVGGGRGCPVCDWTDQDLFH